MTHPVWRHWSRGRRRGGQRGGGFSITCSSRLQETSFPLLSCLFFFFFLTRDFNLCSLQEWPSSLPSLRLSFVPGHLWMTMRRKTPTMKNPSTLEKLPPLLRAQVQSLYYPSPSHCVLAVFISPSLNRRLIFSPSTSPPFIHLSTGVLTFCSPLRRRHVQSCHRSAMPVWADPRWGSGLRVFPGLRQQQPPLCSACIPQWFICFNKQLHKSLSGGGRGGGGGGASRSQWAASSFAGAVQRGVRPPQTRVEDSGAEQQVWLLLLHLGVPRRRGGGRGGGGQRVSGWAGVALQPEELLLRPGLLWRGVLRRRGGAKWSGGWGERVFDVMCPPGSHLYVCPCPFWMWRHPSRLSASSSPLTDRLSTRCLLSRSLSCTDLSYVLCVYIWCTFEPECKAVVQTEFCTFWSCVAIALVFYEYFVVFCGVMFDTEYLDVLNIYIYI